MVPHNLYVVVQVSLADRRLRNRAAGPPLRDSDIFDCTGGAN